ncbi:hypothetical protein BU24DRAFT_90842 [Aaosphaeria arxii CBS 175.79]|uniref:Zn(2)-C6 fungal-type domain-containing protein n=1 Tax=Aaosphaeria arxii CBS 175.79 TaxID=1450172 RepID=A0A6A5X8H3_9PLEO|nr:uncharacterized protein BU24DRAFT_90842 [Aaosphaeria arxii CBS 175.79]KAF2009107.1 hypothetical protein BU24DRAFT_90842 [Aaosphaeria arxii CBS 175.79]
MSKMISEQDDAAFHVFSSTNAKYSDTRSYNKRKVHGKTKAGCVNCKLKRVKCDQVKPSCIRCQRNFRSCSYDRASIHPSASVQSSRSLSILNQMSDVVVIPFEVLNAQDGTPCIHLIKHIQRNWEDIFHMCHSEEIIRLFKSEVLVRSAILALAACHLRHASPGVIQHRVAEHFQQNVALEHYQRVIVTPRSDLSFAAAKTMVLSAILLNMLTFALTPAESDEVRNNDNSASWIINNEENGLGWLVMQASLRVIMNSLMSKKVEILRFLGPIFSEDSKSWVFTQMHRGFEEIPGSWVKMFQLETQGDGCGPDDLVGSPMRLSDVFGPSLIVLAHLKDLQPYPVNIYRHIQFLAKINPEIRRRMHNRDERALWMFGYWLGLVCKFRNIWWCEERARRDYETIRSYLIGKRLIERAGDEGEVWRKMMEQYETATF